ncbi:MAG TPA: NYN domain-containing protein [Candidatus Elarobacter sp.]|nr:NYN domain-containing protein [Candidatus Elarobacter sp.]
MADLAAVFIDGGYLMKLLKEEFGSPGIDFKKLAEEMAGDHDIFRAYYYNCMPHQGTTPNVEEQERYKKARRFYDALNRLPRFEVRLGKLAVRGVDAAGHTIFQQKRVDIMLGVDLVLLAAKNRIAKACLLTGDSDFIPAVQVAKNEGVNVHLFHGNRAQVHDEIWIAADDRTRVDADFIGRIRQIIVTPRPFGNE